MKYPAQKSRPSQPKAKQPSKSPKGDFNQRTKAMVDQIACTTEGR